LNVILFGRALVLESILRAALITFSEALLLVPALRMMGLLEGVASLLL